MSSTVTESNFRGIASDISKGTTYAREDLIVSTTTTTDETSSGSDCFEITGDKTFLITVGVKYFSFPETGWNDLQILIINEPYRLLKTVSVADDSLRHFIRRKQRIT